MGNFMEALKTYTQEKTLAERVNDILAEDQNDKTGAGNAA